MMVVVFIAVAVLGCGGRTTDALPGDPEQDIGAILKLFEPQLGGFDIAAFNQAIQPWADPAFRAVLTDMAKRPEGVRPGDAERMGFMGIPFSDMDDSNLRFIRLDPGPEKNVGIATVGNAKNLIAFPVSFSDGHWKMALGKATVTAVEKTP